MSHKITVEDEYGDTWAYEGLEDITLTVYRGRIEDGSGNWFEGVAVSKGTDCANCGGTL